MARLLAIDYGGKRTGIAVTDILKIIATGLTTVDTPKLLDYLKEYTAKEPVEKFIVGEAKHADGSPAQSSAMINQFVVLLGKTFPDIPIERENESHTSQRAFQAMIDSGISKSKRRDKKLVDKISAVFILQNYMERMQFKNS